VPRDQFEQHLAAPVARPTTNGILRAVNGSTKMDEGLERPRSGANPRDAPTYRQRGMRRAGVDLGRLLVAHAVGALYVSAMAVDLAFANQVRQLASWKLNVGTIAHRLGCSGADVLEALRPTLPSSRATGCWRF
jgi:hypothetical protein